MSEPRKIELISNGFSTPFNPSKTKDKVPPARTQRFCLTLIESTDESCPEFSYTDLCKNVGNSGDNVTTNVDRSALDLADDGSEHESVLLLAQKYEAKYAPKSKKRKREDRVKDLVDLGDGYDDTDSFVDNSEAYDEYIPCSISTKYGGFYINSGLLDLVPVNDESLDEEIPFKKKHRTSRPLLDLDDSQQNQSKLCSNNDGSIKRKRIKEGNGGSVLGEKRRKHKFSDVTKKSDKLRTVAAILNNVSSPIQGTSTLLLDPRSPCVAHCRTAVFPPAAQLFINDDEPIDCSLHPASSSYVAPRTVNESKPTESSFANSALSNVDSIIDAVVFRARQQEEKNKDVSVTSEDPPMPVECLTNEFLDMITTLSKISKLSDDHKIHFFTPEVNRLVLKIDVSVRGFDESIRASILAYVGGFFACGCKGLMKEIRKLNPTAAGNDKLKRCIYELKGLIDRVMPAMMEKYREGLSATEKLKQDRMMDLREQRDGKPDEESEEDDDNRVGGDGGSGAEKPKRITNPRRKFEWTQDIRACLCRCVDIKMKRYEMYKNERTTLEDYLRSFLEKEIKPLWQHGWIQTRILLRESRSAYERWTGGGSGGSVAKPKKLNVLTGKTFAQSSVACSGAERDPSFETYAQSADILTSAANLGHGHSSINVDDQKTYNKSTESIRYGDVYGVRCEPDMVPSSPIQIVQSTIRCSSDAPISRLSSPQSLLEMSKSEASEPAPSSKRNVLENVNSSQSTNYCTLNAERNGKEVGDFKLPATSGLVASSSPKVQATQSTSLDVPAAGKLFKAHSSQSATSDMPSGYLSKVKDYQSTTSDIPITYSSRVKDYQSATLDGYSSKVKSSQSATSDGFSSKGSQSAISNVYAGYSSKPQGSQSITSGVPIGHSSKPEGNQSARAYDVDRKESHKSSSRHKDRSNKQTQPIPSPMFNLTPENLAHLALYSQFFGPLDGMNSAEYLKQFNWEEVLKCFANQALLAGTAVQPKFDQNPRAGGMTSSHSRSSTKEERRSHHGHGRSRSGSSSAAISSFGVSERRGRSFTTPKSSESHNSSNLIAGSSNETCGRLVDLKSPERMRFEQSDADLNLLPGVSNDRNRNFTASKSPESIKFDRVNNIDSNLLSVASSSERYAGFALPKSPEKLRFDSGVSTTPKLASGLSSGVATDRSYPPHFAAASKSPENLQFESSHSNTSSNKVIGISESQQSTSSLCSVVVSGTTSGTPNLAQASAVIDRYAGWRNLYPEKVRKSMSKRERDSSQTKNLNLANKSDLNATTAPRDTTNSAKIVRSSPNSAAATGEDTVGNSSSRASTDGPHIASAAISAIAQHVSSVNNAVARQQTTNTRVLGESNASNLSDHSIGQSHHSVSSTAASQASGIFNNIQTFLNESIAAMTTTTTTAKQSQLPSSVSNVGQLQRNVNLTISNNASVAKQSLQTTVSQAINGQTVGQVIGSQTVNQAIGSQTVGQIIGGQTVNQAIGSQTVSQAKGGQPVSQSIGGQPVSQSIGGQPVSQAIGGQPVSQSIGGQSVSQSIGGKTTWLSETALLQPHLVSLAVSTGYALSLSKTSQLNSASSPSPLSATYRPFSTANHASSSSSSATFLPYRIKGLTVSAACTVPPALATSAPKSYAQSVRLTTPVVAQSSSTSSLQRPHHPQTIEDQVQAELAATQAAQRRRIETLKTYAPPPPPGTSHSIDHLGSKSPRLISAVGGAAEEPPKFMLSSSASGVLLPGAVWRTADLAVSINTSSNLLTTSLDRSTAWAFPSSVSASHAGLVGGCERGSTSSSSQNKIPVSSTSEYQQVAGIQTKP